MKNSIKYFAVMMLSLGVLFTSCTKEVVGPQGPQGEQGPAGPAGPAGADGQDGQDGSSNVNSYTVTANSSDWTSFGTSGSAGYGYAVTFSVPAITATVINEGVVLVYWYINTNYVALPYSFPQNGYVETYLFGFRLGQVEINRMDTDLYTTPPSTSRTFKIVVIEGANKMAPNVDYTDYEAVKAYYNLED